MMKRKLIYLFIALAATILPAHAQKFLNDALTLSNVSLWQQGNSLYIGMTVDMANLTIGSARSLSLIPLLTYSTRRDLREKIYKAYLNRCNNGDEYDNKQLINDFIRLRTEKAHLLGYPSYAAYVVADEMAGTTDAVYGLLDQIWEPALERAKGELSEMDTLLQKDIPGATFESWDWWYYAEKLRKQNYALDEEMLRPYFSLENVQGGIFYLANRLYGITFQPVVVPLYHPDAVAYQVLDADGSHLGVLYFDYFPRDGKSQGAWCGNYVEQILRMIYVMVW